MSSMGGQVLVAEDNAVNQKVMSRILLANAIPHTIVNNGQEAVDFYREHAESLLAILMDCQMPVKDGWATGAPGCRRTKAFNFVTLLHSIYF